MIQCFTTSEEETRRLGRAIAALARAGDVLILDGDLGAGKTRFTQGFAAGLGIEEQVTSPTFTLVRPYEGGRLTLNHADLYRTEGDEAVDLVLSELDLAGGVCVVEWGEPAASLLPAGHLEVRLRLGEHDDDRMVTLTAVGSQWSDRVDDISAALAEWEGGP